MFRGSKSNKLFKCETFFGTYGMFGEKQRGEEMKRGSRAYQRVQIIYILRVKTGNDWCRVG